jgi:hypothetical protein
LDLGKNIQSAFDFAKKMTEDVGRWIVLLIISIIPIVNLITIGYAARVVKETPGSKSPPKLEGYGDLWISGLKVLIAGIIYMIIPMIILVAGAAAFWGSLMTGGLGGPRWTMWPMAGFAGIMTIIGIIVAFLIAIIAFMGIAHMIKTDKFGKAFAFGEIFDIIKKIGWGDYIIWLIVIFIIFIIYGAIGNIPVIGWLIAAVLAPAFVVFIARSIGITYNAGKGKR